MADAGQSWQQVVVAWATLIAAVGGFGWALETLLGFISKITPWKFDDHLDAILVNFLKRFFPKSHEE